MVNAHATTGKRVSNLTAHKIVRTRPESTKYKESRAKQEMEEVLRELGLRKEDNGEFPLGGGIGSLCDSRGHGAADPRKSCCYRVGVVWVAHAAAL